MLDAKSIHYFPEIERAGVEAARIFIEVHVCGDIRDPSPLDDAWKKDADSLALSFHQIWALASMRSSTARRANDDALIIAWDYKTPADGRRARWPAMLCREKGEETPVDFPQPYCAAGSERW